MGAVCPPPALFLRKELAMLPFSPGAAQLSSLLGKGSTQHRAR